MVIVVRRASGNTWYSELVNQFFFVVTMTNIPFYVFGANLHFYPGDVEVVNQLPSGVNINLPQFNSPK